MAFNDEQTQIVKDNAKIFANKIEALIKSEFADERRGVMACEAFRIITDTVVGNLTDVAPLVGEKPSKLMDVYCKFLNIVTEQINVASDEIGQGNAGN